MFEGMTSAGVEVDLRLALRDLTVRMAPELALVVILVQMWATLEASEELTEPTESVPSATVPPEPVKVPLQAVALA